MRLIKKYKDYFIKKKSHNNYFVYSSTEMISKEPLTSLIEAQEFIDKLNK